MRRKYICTNGVVEVTQYTVGDKTQTTGKRWRKAKSQEDKRDENARQAVRVAARILNCNYTHESCLVTLTYSDESVAEFLNMNENDPSVSCADSSPCAGEPMEAVYGEARMLLSKKLEQIRRAAKKTGMEMKTFALTSDLDQ